MKIAVIAHIKHAIRAPFAGGLEMHTYSLCKSLLENGHDVTLFAAAGSAENLQREEICEATGQAASFQKEHGVYSKLMADLRHRDFDVVHNNSLHYLPPALAGGLPMPMVTVLHTPPFWEMEGSITRSRSPNASYVAVSRFIRNLWAPISSTDQVIHNGIDLEQFRPALAPAEPPYLAWSGRIVPEKGLHLAIAAARQAGLALRIAGPISDRPYFESAIAPLLREQARYVGHLGHGALAELIGAAAGLLFTPLWDEPFGLVLAEALACGTPVAAFARGAVAEILDESSGIIVPAGDVAALAAAARALQHLRREDCRRRAENVADLRAMVAHYEALYRRLIRNASCTQNRPPAPPVFPETQDPHALLAHYRTAGAAITSPIPPGLRP